MSHWIVNTMHGKDTEGPSYEASQSWVIPDRETLIRAIDIILKREGKEADLNRLDVSRVTDFSYVFGEWMIDYGEALEKDVSMDDQSSYMDPGLQRRLKFNGDISRWDVSNGVNFEGMFQGSRFRGDISNWDVSSAKNFRGLFRGSWFDGDVSRWNTSQVETLEYAFSELACVNSMGSWDVSSKEARMPTTPRPRGVVSRRVAGLKQVQPFSPNTEGCPLEKGLSLA